MSLLEKIESAANVGNITPSTRDNLVEWVNANFLPVWALASIEALLDDGQYSEVNDRFFKKIAFGTGGMRGRTIGKVTIQ